MECQEAETHAVVLLSCGWLPLTLGGGSPFIPDLALHPASPTAKLCGKQIHCSKARFPFLPNGWGEHYPRSQGLESLGNETPGLAVLSP